MKFYRAQYLRENLRKEIYDALDDMGGYVDYNGKVEALMDDFGLSEADAEGYVWDWSIKNNPEEYEESLKRKSLSEELNIEDEDKVRELIKALQDGLEGMSKEKGTSVEGHQFVEKLLLNTVNRLAHLLGIWD